MEQLIRAVVERLARQGMEVTSIPAFIRNVGNTVSAFPSMSLQELNNHLRLLGWDNFELDSYTFYLMLSTFDPDLGVELTRFCEQPLNSNDLSVFADNKDADRRASGRQQQTLPGVGHGPKSNPET